MAKHLIKRIRAKLFGVLPVIGSDSAVLMLHRVGSRDPYRISANQNMVIEPEELDAFISECRKKGWSFISLDDLFYSIQKKLPLKKTLLLTFDDGYLDNFTLAAPLLLSENVPFAVYVTTNFIGADDVPWWYQLETIIANCEILKTPDGKDLVTKDTNLKNLAFLYVRQKLMLDGTQSQEFCGWLKENYTSSSIEGKPLFMNWRQVKELAASSLVTIGAHTHTHPVLTSLTNQEAWFEIEKSKKVIESKLGRSVKHLAYPYGGVLEVSDREFKYAKELGFDTAVTTTVGSLDPRPANLKAIPRVFFSPDLKLNALQRQLFGVKLKNKTKWNVGHG